MTKQERIIDKVKQDKQLMTTIKNDMNKLKLKLQLSEIREIKRELDNYGIDEFREFIEQIRDDETDFEIDNHRFICEHNIDDILADEITDDLYMLGCFNASFISDLTDIDYDIIETLQDAEAFEGVGKLFLQLCDKSKIAEEYSKYDGYGHHFAHYDGHEQTITIPFTDENNKIVNFDYYFFRIN